MKGTKKKKVGRPKGKGSEVMRIPKEVLPVVKNVVYTYNATGRILTVHRMPNDNNL